MNLFFILILIQHGYLIIADEYEGLEILVSIQDSIDNFYAPKRKPDTKPPPTEVCYPDVGCFHKNGTFKHLKWLPDEPQKINTRFVLFTQDNIDIPVYLDYKNIDSLKNHYFDPERPTKIICHGFTESSRSRFYVSMKNAILQMEDANVIIVDWENGASLPYYLSAVVNTELVGRQTALFIQELKKYRGLSERDIHIIGFSLGAHLAGFIGKTLRDKMGMMVERITGLDPASPFFEDTDDSVHLSYKDAGYVDVIHTSAGDSLLNGNVGLKKSIGHADFYPNGGKDQPGCGRLSACNHQRAKELFIHSILRTCDFRSFPCEDNYEGFQEGRCFVCRDDCGIMGYYSSHENSRGKLFLITRADHPYCGKPIHVSLKNSERQIATYGQVEISLVSKDQIEDVITLTTSKDHQIHPGSYLGGLISAHFAVFPLSNVKVTYSKYKGWFTDGSEKWNIDELTITDEDGIQYCSHNTTLVSNEVQVLRNMECEV